MTGGTEAKSGPVASARRGGAALPGQAWELFRRQGSQRRRTGEEFEKEFKRNAMRGLDRDGKGDEKSLQEWTDGLRAKAQADEGLKMAQENSRFQKLRAWENISLRGWRK